jgi:hypothetical protein
LARATFVAKICTVTLVVVSLLFNAVSYHKFIAFVPWIVFWVVDAHFSRLQKMYQKHYKCLVNTKLHNMYSLDVDRKKLEEKYKGELPSIFEMMFSRTSVAFYGFLFVVIVCTILI